MYFIKFGRFCRALPVLAALLVTAYAHSEDAPVQATTLSLDRCPVSLASRQNRETGVGGVLALQFVQKLVEGAVSVGVNVLQEAAKDKSITSMGTASGYLYKTDSRGNVGANPAFSCIVFYRGNGGIWKGAVDAANTPAARLAAFAQEHRLSALPDFYYEALVEISADDAFYRLRPLAFRYAAKERGWASGRKSAVLTFAFQDPALESGKSTFASAVTPLMPARGEVLGPEELAAVPSYWMPLPQLTSTHEAAQRVLAAEKRVYARRDELRQQIKLLQEQPLAEPAALARVREQACAAAKEAEIEDQLCPSPYGVMAAKYAKEKARLEGLDRLAALKNQLTGVDAELALFEDRVLAKQLQDPASVGVNLYPFNWQATLVETEKASEFMKILASAAQDIAPKVNEAVKQQLDPEARQKKSTDVLAAQRSQIATEGELDQKALAAFNDAEVKKAELASLDATASAVSRVTLEGELRLARTKANMYFRQIGRTEPFPGAF